MALHSNVPKFGNWESENVPYTVYFDKARKNRGGKITNPNDPQENPDMFPNNDPSPLLPASSNSKSGTKSDEPIETGGAFGLTVPEHRRSKEDGDFRHFSNSPDPGENTGTKTANESSYGGRAQRPAPPTRRSEGSEQGFLRSPLHPHYQAKVAGRGSGSPAWERKNHDSSHGTPGRYLLKPSTTGDESPVKVAAVPKFGAWDENDPQSDGNYTQIFNKVREERNTEAGNVTGTPKHPSYGTRAQQPKESKKRGWFCW